MQALFFSRSYSTAFSLTTVIFYVCVCVYFNFPLCARSYVSRTKEINQLSPRIGQMSFFVSLEVGKEKLITMQLRRAWTLL